jgi:hypothetical protein
MGAAMALESRWNRAGIALESQTLSQESRCIVHTTQRESIHHCG